MKKNLSLILCLIFCQLIIGQNFEPQIIILTPNEIKIQKSLRKEISKINESLKKSSTESSQSKNYISSSEFLEQPENIQQMIRSEIEYSKEMNFFKQISSISEQYLTYRFYEKFPNVLIMLSNEKDPGFIKTIGKEKLQYILSFPSVEIYQNRSMPYVNIAVQLFDSSTETILLDKVYTGNSFNPGFEFACEDSTLNCTINNALSEALDDIIQVVAIRSPTLQRERQLIDNRYNKLLEDYLTGDVNVSIIEGAIAKSDSTISLSDCYQTIKNASQSKFVAFFIKQVSSQSFKQLTANQTDQNVQIISPKDLKEEGFFDEIPKTYAYLVKGVKYDNNWFYEKSSVTYFQPESLEQGKKEYFNNLQKWNFFKDNTIEFNTDFWETSLFNKVKDLKKDPDWDKYGEGMWMTDEINDREYIGLYEIVAKVLRNRNNILNSKFEENMEREVFAKFYDELKNSEPGRYSEISPHAIIFPKDRNIALNPVLISNTEGIKSVHYFLAFKNASEIYEWIYFKPAELPTTFYGNEVVNQIGSLTDWNFSADNLNDENFWKYYVLTKVENTYKYLLKVN